MRRLAVLGIALVGLTFLLTAVGQVLAPLSLLSANFGSGLPKWAAAVLLMLPSLISAAGGLFLLLRRESLAERWFPEPESQLTIAGDGLARVGVVLIGLSLVVHAIPTLISQLTAPVVTIVMIKAQVNIGMGMSDVLSELSNSIPAYLGTIASFVVGWLMIARSQPLAAWLVRTRQPAAEPEQDSEL